MENFEIHLSQMSKNAPKLSTTVEENFEIYPSQWQKMHLNYHYKWYNNCRKNEKKNEKRQEKKNQMQFFF